MTYTSNEEKEIMREIKIKPKLKPGYDTNLMLKLLIMIFISSAPFLIAEIPFASEMGCQRRTWQCPKCKYHNSVDNPTCQHCGYYNAWYDNR